MLKQILQTVWALFRPFLLAGVVCISLIVFWLDFSAALPVETAVTSAVSAPSRPTLSDTLARWTRAQLQFVAASELPAAETAVETALETAVFAETIPAYGVNHISYDAPQPISADRYEKGLSTGATWNRWPLYWHEIEQAEGDFHWSYQDTSVRADLAYGLRLNAILLGTPDFYRTGSHQAPATVPPSGQPNSAFTLNAAQTATPRGLYDPIFDDSSDIPGAGKNINPDNVWARFVWTAVTRYKPGGLLAQQENWPASQGVTHWEMWNEPDLSHFWDGSVADYARLLKVGYLAAKQADPEAQVLFGGLALVYDPTDIPYLTEVLEIYDQDPLAVEFGYFHDILALHNYSFAYRSWRAVYIAGRRLAARDLDNPIWLNESGVPVWDDYPGPVCEPLSPYRATMSEQADFIIQSALYAVYAGAHNIFFFQLFDDCGNDPAGLSHPPVTDCAIDPSGGDAFGLFRNVNDSAVAQCHWNHPEGNTARPGLLAYQALTTHFQGVEPLWRLRPDGFAQEWIAFYRPATGSRLVGLWSLTGAAATAVISSTNSAQTGLLVHADGYTETITAVNGVFTLTLPAATNQNTPTGLPLYPIGGRPFLLIEPDTIPPEVTASGPATAVGSAYLSWSGEDWGSGVQSYAVAVAIDEGAPQPWLQDTTAVNGTYPVMVGHTYTFLVTARDRAGNLSQPVSVTITAPDLPEKAYLPLVNG